MPDVLHEFYPQYFSADVLNWRRRNYLPSAENASVVLTCSEYAKRTIVEQYGIAPGKVEPVYHGVEDEFLRPPPETPSLAFRKLALPEQYFFFPANFWPHKNHVNLLKALQILHASGSPRVNLVFTGARGPDRDQVAGEIKRLGLSGSVRLLEYQPREVLPEIYRHARGLVFATEHEGFGIPVLEAMTLGVPVITSRGGATEEVASGAALLVDEKDPGSIADAMQRLIADRQLANEMAQRGLKRAGDFSWEQSGRQVLQIFDRLAKEAPRSAPPIEVSEYPTISVVTPSFNTARYIGETIESVLSQDYPHIEYVVMDGGSTDGTQEILKKYEDRIRWRSEPDRGQADAVNKGFALTSGQVFAFLNSDDTYRPGALATIGETFRRRPRLGLVYGEAYHVDEAGAVIRRYETQAFDFEKLNYDCYICQPSAFASREAFERAGMLDSSLQISLDYDMWIRLAAANQVIHIPEYLANWRMHHDIKSLRDRRAVYQEIFATVQKHFGYVPYSWINGYACHIVDKNDQFFEPSSTTLPARLLSLYLGLKMNHGQRRRYLADWIGLGSAASAGFDGQWEDGWVSRRHRRILHQQAGSARLIIRGRHASPFLLPLRMHVRLDGSLVGEKTMYWRGSFEKAIVLPDAKRARDASLVLEFNKAWRPGGSDQRMLACVVDEVVVEQGDSTE